MVPEQNLLWYFSLVSFLNPHDDIVSFSRERMFVLFPLLSLNPSGWSSPGLSPVWLGLPPLGLQTCVHGATSALPCKTYLQADPPEGPLTSPIHHPTRLSNSNLSRRYHLHREVNSSQMGLSSFSYWFASLFRVHSIHSFYVWSRLICFMPDALRRLYVAEAYATAQGKLRLLTQSDGYPSYMSQPYIWLQETENQTAEA